jgi:hypothetical protein
MVLEGANRQIGVYGFESHQTTTGQKVEVYYECILKLANCLNHIKDNNLLTTFFQAKLVPYLWVSTTRMKLGTLFLHKEVVVTCKESMGDVNEYRKLLEPPPKPKKWYSYFICGGLGHKIFDYPH